MATSHIADSVGRVLAGRYRLMRRIGQGAFAQVYAADDVTLRRRVAIKVLRPGLADERAFLRRFAAEAQVVAGLRHPHILRVYDWGEDDGDPYLVMELLEGGSLRSYLDQGRRLSLSQAARVGADVASALDYAQRRGLVHRDIKPANLIFDDEGRIALADFGMARALAEATLTEPTGSVVGTARYAAPEQLHGEALDGRADVYALALVLVEATTGQVPFAMDTSLATLMRRLHQPISAPPEVGALGPVVEAAGTVEVGDRLVAVELVARLEAVAAELPPPARLELAGPLARGGVEVDYDPTDIPGRPVLFDEDEAGDLEPGGGFEGADSDGDGFDGDIDGGGFEGADFDGDELEVDDEWSPAPPRRRRWRVTSALAGVVALVAGGGVAYEATRPPPAPPPPPPIPTYAVPQLAGDTTAVATAATRRAHLVLVVSGRAYSPIAAPGSVLTQEPAAARRLRAGRRVTVVVSKGPEPIPVPDVAGKTQAQATAALTSAGLAVGTVTKATSLTVPTGSVISESPATGTLLPHQSVALVVSTGKPMVTVPTLSGPNVASYTAAAAALKAIGLPTTETTEYSNDVPKGQVIVTNPAPGAVVVYGTSVTVVVSLGPHLAVVPNVAGDSVDAAAEALGADGFRVAGVDGSPLGMVTSTSPAAGDAILYGSSVTLTTG